ncbi:MAG: ADP-forming succinate--CoA ligase subunit beta [Anaerolineales bacterium]|nr:MAG: ADP-forming succinate--CoA ligase subunit beta [Anaerolineales bacterium]
MKLHEYQSKRIFARYGVPIPRGDVASTPDDAYKIAARLKGRVVVKAQVLVGGRGKAGGIKLAKDAPEAEAKASQILGMDIGGLKVRKVLIDEAAMDIIREIYLGIVIDRAACCPVMMASAEGGVEIEEVAKVMPERIFKVSIDPFLGLRGYQARELAFGIGLEKSLISSFISIATGLYNAFVGCDASLAEINPLLVTDQSGGLPSLSAVDGKMIIDDNALFRHSDLTDMRDVDEEALAETEARYYGLSYVKLDGEIGCMVNGAGLAMATMDIIKLYGGMPANFLDIGGGAQADRVAAALRIILADPKVKAVLFNIFGGITRCDEVAKGVLDALEQVPTDVPMVARLVGTNEEEGRRILAGAKMATGSTLVEAAQKAVELAQAR